MFYRQGGGRRRESGRGQSGRGSGHGSSSNDYSGGYSRDTDRRRQDYSGTAYENYYGSVSSGSRNQGNNYYGSSSRDQGRSGSSGDSRLRQAATRNAYYDPDRGYYDGRASNDYTGGLPGSGRHSGARDEHQRMLNHDYQDMYNRSYLYPNARQRGPDPFASGMSERDLQLQRQARQQAADRQAAYDGPPPGVSWDNWYGSRGNIRNSDRRDATFRRVER